MNVKWHFGRAIHGEINKGVVFYDLVVRPARDGADGA
jgi:hypothetical protein